MMWEGENRRKFPRANFPCLIKLSVICDEQSGILAHTENISLCGVRVLIKQRIEQYALVTIELDLMDGDFPVACQGKVVWVRLRNSDDPVKPSLYETGIEIQKFSDADRVRVEAVVEHCIKHIGECPSI